MRARHTEHKDQQLSKRQSTSVNELSLDLRQKGKIKFGGFEDKVFSLGSLSKNTRPPEANFFHFWAWVITKFSGSRPCKSKDNLPQPQDSWGHVSTHTRQCHDRHMNWIQPIQQLCSANKQRHLDQH